MQECCFSATSGTVNFGDGAAGESADRRIEALDPRRQKLPLELLLDLNIGEQVRGKCSTIHGVFSPFLRLSFCIATTICVKDRRVGIQEIMEFDAVAKSGAEYGRILDSRQGHSFPDS